MQRWLIVLFVGAFVAGCGGRGARLDERPTKKLPPVPTRRDVPVDPALLERATAELLAAARSPDAVVRAHAIESMSRSMKVDAKEQILAAMKDPAARVRYAGAMAAGQLELKEVREPALALAEDKNSSVRIAARFALHQAGDYSLSHDLESTSKSEDKNIRADTALVLGLMNEPSATKILLPMLMDRDPVVRYQAAESLWRLGDSAALEMLVAGTLSGYPDDQMMCLLALAAPKRPQITGHVRNGLTTDYDEVNLVAARAMGMLGSDEGYGWAVDAVDSAEPRQRLQAALAFGAIGRPDAQRFLAPLLRDTDANVRLAAAEAIVQLRAAGTRSGQGASGS